MEKLVNLKELKLLLDNKILELKTLVSKRNESILDEYMFLQGEPIIYDEAHKTNAVHEYLVDDLTKQINTLENEILNVKELLTIANSTTKIDFEGTEILLSTAIFKVKSLRDGLPSLNRLSNIKESREVTMPNRYNEEKQVYKIIKKPTYDTNTYKDIAKRVESDIIALQSAIDKANINTVVKLTI